MAVRLIPNQLVKLYDTETLNERNKRLTLDYRTYCQIVRDEQTTMFQLQLLPDSENLITNGDFQNDISDWHVINPEWQWASGRLQGIKTSTAKPNIYQDVSTVAGMTYNFSGRIQFVDHYSTLTIIASQTNILPLVYQAWVYQAADRGLEPFDFNVNFVSDLTGVRLNFLLSGGNFGNDIIGGVLPGHVYIDNLAIYELTEPVVTLETCSGNNIRTIPVFDRSGDYLTYAVDWFGLNEGCYRICITGIDDTQKNFLDRALALGTESGAPIELEQGGFLKWFG